MSSTATIGVLIVDDHPMFAESLGRLLADEVDITVVGVATNSSQVLEMTARLAPDVAIVDYHMPKRDGVLIAADIKLKHPEVSVLMLSGTIDDRLVAAAIGAGCSGFLTKDRTAEEVVRAVRAVAAGEAAVSMEILGRLLPRAGRPHQSLGDDLTARELQILSMLADGRTNARIADDLHLSVNTIRNYVQVILTKLNAHSKLEAVATAIRERVITYPGEL
jgi:DNA-binding NarL/FixJ family response regulator